MKTLFAALALSLALPTMAAADELETISSIETSLWKAWGKADGETFKNNLAEDAVFAIVDVGVTYGRDAIAGDVSKGGCELKDFGFSELKLKKLGRKSAMLSYKATQDASCDGQKLPAAVFVTAVYVKEGRKWVALTHQETVIATP